VRVSGQGVPNPRRRRWRSPHDRRSTVTDPGPGRSSGTTDPRPNPAKPPHAPPSTTELRPPPRTRAPSTGISDELPATSSAAPNAWRSALPARPPRASPRSSPCPLREADHHNTSRSTTAMLRPSAACCVDQLRTHSLDAGRSLLRPSMPTTTSVRWWARGRPCGSACLGSSAGARSLVPRPRRRPPWKASRTLSAGRSSTTPATHDQLVVLGLSEQDGVEHLRALVVDDSSRPRFGVWPACSRPAMPWRGYPEPS
jgi:hypothetical protein